MTETVTISTHTTHVGGDVSDSLCNGIYTEFQLTPPMWVATACQRQNGGYTCHFNSHHPCGWRHADEIVGYPSVGISTHTTHVGGDRSSRCQCWADNDFNSHHPCGWRHYSVTPEMLRAIFQLTPPMWVATHIIKSYNCFKSNFNSHHPCGWRQSTSKRLADMIGISTHTTHVGGD